MGLNFISKISPKNRLLKKAEAVADAVIALEGTYHNYTDLELRNKTSEFEQQLANGATLDDILIPGLATIREVAYRTYGMLAYRVQLIGAIIVHFGDFAEMMTGEGKTLTLVLASYVTALLRKGVHVISVNEYLVERDASFALEALGRLQLSVGYIKSSMSPEEKRRNYLCDVTYVPNTELGFDYLRDNMVKSYDEKVQRGLYFAIVDEADSVLIDEARTPLIISGQPKNDVSLYKNVQKFAETLTEDDYVIEHESQSVVLSDKGALKAEAYFDVKNLYDIENSDILHKIINALRANFVFQEGVEYIVRHGKNNEDEIALVDHFTGRIMEGRSYSAGLQQAIQAKEYVKIEPENLTVATITYQSLFCLYKKLSGVSGTAYTESEELLNIYNMIVVQIPTNKPIVRVDHPDYVFNNKKTKWKYVVAEIVSRHKTGQPILVGTGSVEDSEIISRFLNKLNIPHNVLNAKNHASEAAIIAKAGQKDQVTIATYMAGRGTDIKLGEGVKELGGLYVIGTERSESRRIDNQLRGRSGRQGDVGESRFFISLADDLFKKYSGDLANKAENEIDDEYINTKFFTRLLNNTQKRIEGLNYDVRKNLNDYDHVLSNQRELVYKQRDNILMATDLSQILERQVHVLVNDIISRNTLDNNLDLVNINAIVEHIQKTISQEVEFITAADFPNQKTIEVANILLDKFTTALNDIMQEMGKDYFYAFMKHRLIEYMDTGWTTHLDLISKLREGVNLRAYEQKSPLNIYIQDADALFNKYKSDVAVNTISSILTQGLRRQEFIKNMGEISLDGSSIQINDQNELVLLAKENPVDKLEVTGVTQENDYSNIFDSINQFLSDADNDNSFEDDEESDEAPDYSLEQELSDTIEQHIQNLQNLNIFGLHEPKPCTSEDDAPVTGGPEDPVDTEPTLDAEDPAAGVLDIPPTDGSPAVDTVQPQSEVPEEQEPVSPAPKSSLVDYVISVDEADDGVLTFPEGVTLDHDDKDDNDKTPTVDDGVAPTTPVAIPTIAEPPFPSLDPSTPVVANDLVASIDSDFVIPQDNEQEENENINLPKSDIATPKKAKTTTTKSSSKPSATKAKTTTSTKNKSTSTKAKSTKAVTPKAASSKATGTNKTKTTKSTSSTKAKTASSKATKSKASTSEE